ncbi:hypothetical protein QFZ33_002637 [Arthrobacter globiformis]|nr:hypothetical protein [Arthrobacter globiformis]
MLILAGSEPETWPRASVVDSGCWALPAIPPELGDSGRKEGRRQSGRAPAWTGALHSRVSQTGKKPGVDIVHTRGSGNMT